MRIPTARHPARPPPAAVIGGFTLIEVLVAIAIVAVALAAGLGLSMSLTRQAERGAELLLAELCARNALAELRLLRQMPAAGSRLQSCEQSGRRFDVSLSVRTSADADLLQVHAQVSQRGSVLLQLSTLVGRY